MVAPFRLFAVAAKIVTATVLPALVAFPATKAVIFVAPITVAARHPTPPILTASRVRRIVMLAIRQS